VLIEYGDESLKRIIEHPIDAAHVLATRPLARRVHVKLDVGRLHRPDDIAHPDLACRPRQSDATVSAARRRHEPVPGKNVNDLEYILHSEIKRSREIGDFYELALGSRALDQNSDGMAGRFVQSHVHVAWQLLGGEQMTCDPIAGLARKRQC
jgi:hypothetical protein